VDPRFEAGAGHYKIKELDDELVGWGYWHAYLDGKRVNGGVCNSYTDGVFSAKMYIGRARELWLHENFYWDHETCQWVRHGHLPSVS
jgi:hypothetical protein